MILYFSFEHGEQRIEQLSTIGIENSFATFKLTNGEVIRCNFYDTNGTKRFRPSIEPYYKKINGCIIVYDITKKSSFDEIEDYYIPKIKEKCKENTAILILGNKADQQNMRKVSFEEANQLASRYHYLYKETSCIKNINLTDVFKIIIEYTYKNFVKRLRVERNNNPPIRINNGISIRRCFRC